MSWRALAQLITALENEKASGVTKGDLSKPISRLLVQGYTSVVGYQKYTCGGHHRHRWCGQIVAYRRADSPLAPGPGRQPAHVAVISD
jgi:hypothetical protein